jgi:hypothetical protein
MYQFDLKRIFLLCSNQNYRFLDFDSVCEEIAAGSNPKHPLGNMIRWSGYTLDGLKHLNFGNIAVEPIGSG